jgi:glutamate--cysteine ligase
MARDSSDATPIETRDALAAYLEAGAKPRDKFRIGTEHEKFVFRTHDLAPVPYEGPRGIEALLTGMRDLLGWEPILDEGRIIGLADPIGGGAISLEPGGQFELSGAPLVSLHETDREVTAHRAQVREIGKALGLSFLGMGFSPLWSRAETPAMPKGRYAIMSRYMPKVGTKGLDMMFRTSTVQVNLDFSSEADMAKKMRVSLALQPVASALFAASPFSEGKPNGFLTYRSEIWRDTDRHRTGNLPVAFDPAFGFEHYVDWAMDVPLYFLKRGATYHDVTGVPFRALMEGKVPGHEGERATLSDWTNHLGTLFPDVRLKRYIEMRGADAGPRVKITALAALWVGLLYDDTALDAAWDLVKGWTAEERLALRDTVPRLALKTPFRDGTLLPIATEMVRIARGGLRRRGLIDPTGCSEARHLDPLEDIVSSGVTTAERMLEAYRGAWGGRIEPVFADYEF